MKKVFVTGCTGFIGTHVVKELLENGYKVIGTIRPNTLKKHDYLYNFKNAKEHLKVVKVDIMKEEDFYSLVKECEGVFHTACPLPGDYKQSNAKTGMYDISLNGTMNLLNACAKDFSNIKRVVYTSTASAIRQAINYQLDYNYIFSCDDWNETSTLQTDPYGYSKTTTEKTAINFVKKNGEKKFDMVTVNPSLVFGHVLHDISQGLNFSSDIIPKVLCKKEINCEKTYSSIHVCDVVHVMRLIYENEKCSMKRFFLTHHGISEEMILKIVKEKFSNEKSMKKLFEIKRTFLGDKKNIKNKTMKFELRNLKKYLNMDEKKFISIEQSVIDCVETLIKKNYFVDLKQTDESIKI